MDEEFKRAYADAYPDRLPDYVAGRWSHVCADGNMRWCRHGEHCAICLKREDDGLGHHGPKDRDRTGPGAVPRRPTGDHTVSLKDEIVAAIDAAPADNPMWMDAAADAILALVLAHATGSGGVERGVRAWVRSRGKSPIEDAILAALGDTHD